ncbi:GDP-L-fucose synthase family protein [Helicobacter sp.]|uniref:GDP-L-fucose synthase family protein n=1 Tax=Helicobacter sp. TaxID=218 RepID=UPI0025BE6B75|nr:GDP-L-fucose synthase [Helicobacter sp.]MCI5968559.1 GDP-L-fucose synthase [Helicobacter sp.]MDY2584769.1 GDP-L-fucose synthase [Helicobacter sp.]
MKKDSKIYVAGHRGLTGSAIVKNLRDKGYENLVYRTHSELDLTNQVAVREFFEKEKPEYVFLSAAKVGGISANNTYRADFIYQNLMIQNNVIHQSYLSKTKKLLFLGTTCIYPKESPQPIKEEYLLTSPLEYTNEPYAIAKIAGLKMCESYNLQYGTNFISVMPTGIYGADDNFDLENCHVLPALIRKMHLSKLLAQANYSMILKDLNLDSIEKAKEYCDRFGIRADGVEIWGSGNPRREFLHSSDMADACVFVMENIDFKDLCVGDTKEVRNTHINIGYGSDVSIKELAEMIGCIVGFGGKLFFDATKPDGTFRKLPDCSRLQSFGWKYKVALEQGVKMLYQWYLDVSVKRG